MQVAIQIVGKEYRVIYIPDENSGSQTENQSTLWGTNPFEKTSAGFAGRIKNITQAKNEL